MPKQLFTHKGLRMHRDAWDYQWDYRIKPEHVDPSGKVHVGNLEHHHVESILASLVTPEAKGSIHVEGDAGATTVAGTADEAIRAMFYGRSRGCRSPEAVAEFVKTFLAVVRTARYELTVQVEGRFDDDDEKLEVTSYNVTLRSIVVA